MPAFAGKSVSNANVGAAVEKYGRHIKFLDGSVMVDGKFSDLPESAFGSLYTSTSDRNCFMINTAGKITQLI